MRSPFSPVRRFRRRVDPGMPILAEATAAHGITDLAVAEAATFEEIGPKLEGFLGAADLAGFGIRHLAIPMLVAEFRRAGVHFGWIGRRVVDLRKIYLHHHPCDLGVASRHYLDRELPAQPGAMDEAESSSALLDAQIIRHEEMPTHVADLAEFPIAPTTRGCSAYDPRVRPCSRVARTSDGLRPKLLVWA
jgi:DNA polymerase III subunit epsilon